MSTYARLKRDQSFMDKPASGWLHQDDALQAGEEGIFYSFPITYCGSIVIDESLRPLNADEQTLITRELMAIVAEKGGCRPQSQHGKLSSKLQKYCNGKITVAMIDCNLYVSAAGLAVAPEGFGFDGFHERTSSSKGLLEYHHMRNISLAAGGEMRDYDLVSYVAKDDRNKRECYVFDCGQQSDEVLTTIGQAFVLAQQRKAPKQQATQAVEKLYEKAGEYLQLPIYDEAGPRKGGNSDYHEITGAGAYSEFGPTGAPGGVANPMYDRTGQSYLDIDQAGGAIYDNKDASDLSDEMRFMNLKAKGGKGGKGAAVDDDQYLVVNDRGPGAAKGGKAAPAGDDQYLLVDGKGKGGKGGKGPVEDDQYLALGQDGGPLGKGAAKGGKGGPAGDDQYLYVGNKGGKGGKGPVEDDQYLALGQDGGPLGKGGKKGGAADDGQYLDVSRKQAYDAYEELPGAQQGGRSGQRIAGNASYIGTNPDGPVRGVTTSKQGDPGYADFSAADQYLDVNAARGGRGGIDPGYLDISNPLYISSERLRSKPRDDPGYLDIDDKHLRVVQGLNALDIQRRKAYEEMPSQNKRPGWVFVDQPDALPKISLDEVRKQQKSKRG